MKALKTLIFLPLVVFPSLLIASENPSIVKNTGHYHPGIYYDNLNSLNVRFGYSHYLAENPYESVSLRSSVISGEIEAGLNGYKVTLSHGHVGYSAGMGGALRYGLSYGNIDNDDMVGIESVVSVIGVSLKLGLFRNLDQNSNELMFGIGFGL